MSAVMKLHCPNLVLQRTIKPLGLERFICFAPLAGQTKVPVISVRQWAWGIIMMMYEAWEKKAIWKGLEKAEFIMFCFYRCKK